MEVNLGFFKSLMLFESLYGTCTVSLQNLEQSKLKVSYTVFFIVLYVVEQILFGFNDRGENPMWEYSARMFTILLPMYSLIWSIFDYKTKISAALNLEAIEEKLMTQGFKVSGTRWLLYSSTGLVALNAYLNIWSLWENIVGLQTHLPVTRYVTAHQNHGTQINQALGLILFLAKASVIQDAITKGFSLVLQSQEESTAREDQTASRRRVRNRGGKTCRVKTESDKKWDLLSELQCHLHITESSIRDSYWVHIIWYRLVAEVLTPLLCFRVDTEDSIGWFKYFLEITISFIAIVFTVERVSKGKKAALTALSNNVLGSGRVRVKSVKHQLLAKIHRRRVTFSCVLFDVDYNLLATFLENSLFVVTAVLATIKSR